VREADRYLAGLNFAGNSRIVAIHHWRVGEIAGAIIIDETSVLTAFLEVCNRKYITIVRKRFYSPADVEYWGSDDQVKGSSLFNRWSNQIHRLPDLDPRKR